MRKAARLEQERDMKSSLKMHGADKHTIRNIGQCKRSHQVSYYCTPFAEHSNWVMAIPSYSHAVPAALQVTRKLAVPSKFPSSASLNTPLTSALIYKEEYSLLHCSTDGTLQIKSVQKRIYHQLTSMLGMLATAGPIQANGLTAQPEVVTTSPPLISFAAFPIIVMVMRSTGQVRQAEVYFCNFPYPARIDSKTDKRH